MNIVKYAGLIVFLLVFSGCVSQQDEDAPFFYTDETGKGNAFEPLSNVSAQLPRLDEDSGVSDYLAYAALNNPGLEAAFNDWKAAMERIPQARSLPDPRLEYKYYIEEVETRVGPQRQGVSISQMFPWFGKLRLRGEAAAEAAEAARQRYEAEKLELFFEVRDAYYEYYYLARSIAVTKENIALVKHLEGVAGSRYKSAAGTHPDVVRAQVEAGKLENRHRSLLDMRKPLQARLNAALNRPPETEILFPSEVPSEDIVINESRLLSAFSAVNPQLKAMDSEIKRHKKDIKLAGKEFYPDMTFGLGFIDTDDASSGAPSDSGKDPVIASVSINIPLWRDKYKAGVNEARHKYYAAIGRRRDKENTLNYRLKRALYEYRDAERKMDLYKNALLPKSKESLKVTESGYRSGSSSFTDLIDAQRILLEFSLSYERALVDRAKSLARLEKLTGGEIGDKIAE
mgnify:CR=1 FL=1